MCHIFSGAYSGAAEGLDGPLKVAAGGGRKSWASFGTVGTGHVDVFTGW